MILDSSAIAAIFLREPEAERFTQLIADTSRVAVSAATFVEVGIVLSYRLQQPMQHLIEDFLRTMAVEILPFTDEHRRVALDAWWRYGRTRHEASLNYGDCLAYATARVANEPLLCKGNDFQKTDLELVGDGVG